MKKIILILFSLQFFLVAGGISMRRMQAISVIYQCAKKIIPEKKIRRVDINRYGIVDGVSIFVDFSITTNDKPINFFVATCLYNSQEKIIRINSVENYERPEDSEWEIEI